MMCVTYYGRDHHLSYWRHTLNQITTLNWTGKTVKMLPNHT